LTAELAAHNKALLTTLASARGSILDNAELLASLDRTKAAAVATGAALGRSKELQAELDGQRDGYLPVARQAAVVWFALADLRALSGMYRVSLRVFWALFARALAAAAPSADVPLRTAAIRAVRLALFTVLWALTCLCGMFPFSDCAACRACPLCGRS
jgi:hypothetical protein